MDEQDFDSRTEAPTQKRREDARRRGQVAQSADLATGAALLSGATVLWFAGARLGGNLEDALRDGLHRLAFVQWGTVETLMAFRWTLGHFVQCCGMMLAAFLATSVLIGLLQVGPQISWQPLSPNWGRISPTSGLSRLFSSESMFRGGVAILKVGTVLTVLILGIRAAVDRRGGAMPLDFSQLLAQSWNDASRLLLWSAGAALGIGGLDFAWQFSRNERRLRMTRNEIKDEQKEDNGSPELRARVRSLQREAAKQRGIQDVPQASVVITNPTHYAVALRYTPEEMSAPAVIAKGEGRLALRIKQIAHEHGIEVLERKPLARALYRMVPIGGTIPTEFYQVIAEILAQVYRLKNGT